MQNNLQIKQPFYDLPLTGNYQLIFADATTWQVSSDEVLELLNEHQQFPSNRDELRIGFKLPNGILIKELL